MNETYTSRKEPLAYLDGPCAICKELDHGANIIAQTATCVLLQSNDDALPDSAIIVPRRHALLPLDLTEIEWMETFALMRDATTWLSQQRLAGGFTIGWNCTPVGGQSVPHVHMHVIGRHEHEGLTRGRGIRGMLKRPELREGR